MKVSDLFLALHQESSKRAYVTRLEVLDQSASVIKARLYISPDLFIQVYRNDRFDTTNLVLIHNGQRVYARDQLGGIWHRHTSTEPYLHDIGAEGRQAVTLAEFLDEAEIVLADLRLP